MSLSCIAIVECDAGGCNARVEARHMASALATAIAQGWVCVEAGKESYCPACVEALTYEPVEQRSQ